MNYLEELIGIFDSFDLENDLLTRYAYKPLYDLVQYLFIDIASLKMKIDKSIFLNRHLSQRWAIFSLHLEQLENQDLISEIKKWKSDLIDHLDKFRNKVEHTDFKSDNLIILNREKLIDIRSKIKDFIKWFQMITDKYQKIIGNFDFKQYFYIQVQKTKESLEKLIDDYKEGSYIYSLSQYDFLEHKYDKNIIDFIIDKLEDELKNYNSPNNISQSDIFLLVNANRIISNILGRQVALYQIELK